MCTVSMIMDHYTERWHHHQQPVHPFTDGTDGTGQWQQTWPQREMPINDEEVLEFRRLLDRARKYDRDNNEPNCEMDEKKQRLLELARELGADVGAIEDALEG